MIELGAALVGSLSTAALMALGFNWKKADEGSKAAVRLTLAVENVAARLEELHVDFKSDRRETYGRLNLLEQRVAKLEALK